MPMKLSVSMRVAEDMSDKRKAAMSLEDMARMAKDSGFHAVCMRASQVGTHTPSEVVNEKREYLDSLGLAVSMATGDFPIPENNERGPDALRNITPYLDLAEALDCDLLRICMKKDDDIVWAQRASDEAAERSIRLAHQSHHTASSRWQDGRSKSSNRSGDPTSASSTSPPIFSCAARTTALIRLGCSSRT